MQVRRLGSTGLEVSELGFGAWGIGGPADGAPAYGPTDDRESKLALRRAYDLGITFYDTSDLYGHGHSERLLGEALKEVRHDVVIATKVGLLDIGGAQDFSTRHIQHSLEASLKRLQTDYVDLYLLHGPSLETLDGHGDVLDTLQALEDEGKVRAYGISLRSPEDGAAVISKFGFKCIQVNFNLVDQRALGNGLFDLCHQNDVGVIVRTPLCFGLLTGAHGAGSRFDSSDHRSRWSADQINRWTGAPQLFAGGLSVLKGQTPAQFALRFCLSYPSVSTVIPGMLLKSEVEENVLASSMGPLSRIEILEVEKVYKDNTFFVSESTDRTGSRAQA